jgi:preprotein translocase subunit SecG
MLTFFTVVHVLLCIFMIFVILLQPGKDAGMGAALGGGAATSAFGGRGAATFLTKVTAVCAVGFFLTSLGLSFVGLRSSVSSQLGAEPAAAVVPAPTPTEAAPAAPGTQPAVNDQKVPSANDAVPADKLPQ